MDAAFADLTARLGAARAIAADDVLSLRQSVYGEGAVTREEAEVLVALDAAADSRAPEWGDFFAEALSDLVVHQQDPDGYVNDATATWLIRVLTAAGRLRRDSVVEALARIADEATEVPQSLDTFILVKVRDAVLADGAVTKDDIEVLRRVIFAGGGEGNLGVTREEAEALFDIDAACRSGANDPAWPDFFARTIADCLTAASPYRPEHREDALRDEAWLAKPQTFGDFAKGMMHKPDLGGALHEILHPYADQDAEWAADEAKLESDEAADAPVTDEEWKWLKDRIDRGGPQSEAEQRLLAFLKDAGEAAPSEAESPAPIPTVAQPGALAPAMPSGGTVFGHRGLPPVAAVGASEPS